MSYYISKHPGLYAYLMLLTLSVIGLTTLPESQIILGALSVLWGITCMMRVLSLFEVQEYFEDYTTDNKASKTNNTQSTGLAYDLTRRMRGHNHFKRGLAAMECIEPRTLLWFGIAGLYIIATLYFGQDDNITQIALLFMIGAAFWMGQSYAYSLTATRLISGICIALLTGASLTLNPEISHNTIHLALSNIISNPALIMLIALIAYSAGVLIHALVENPRQSALVITGMLILGIFSFCYIAFEPSTNNIPLWLPGWALFSLIWIRVLTAPQKRYTLYPC